MKQTALQIVFICDIISVSSERINGYGKVSAFLLNGRRKIHFIPSV